MSSTSIVNGDVICCGRASNCQGTQKRRSTPVLRGPTNAACESRFGAPPAERSWGHQSGWSWPRAGVVEDHLAADEGRAAGTGGARALTSRRQNCVERAIRLGLPLWGQLPGEHQPGHLPPGSASLTKRSRTAGARRTDVGHVDRE
jgi:hypothetical protein